MVPMSYLKFWNYLYRPTRRQREDAWRPWEDPGGHRGQFPRTSFVSRQDPKNTLIWETCGVPKMSEVQGYQN